MTQQNQHIIVRFLLEQYTNIDDLTYQLMIIILRILVEHLKTLIPPFNPVGQSLENTNCALCLGVDHFKIGALGMILNNGQ